MSPTELGQAMTNGIHKGMRTTLGGLHRMLDRSPFCNLPEVGRTLHNATTVQDRLTYASPDDPLPKRLLIRSIESLTGYRRLARVYDHVPHQQIPRLPSERRAEWRQRNLQQRQRVVRTPILGESYSWRQLPRKRA